VFNIGHSEPVALMDFIQALEKALGCNAIKQMLPMQSGDVVATYADTHRLQAWTGVHPEVPIEEGVQRFVAWYRRYFDRR
jgi:UDP-glucuronate 4-epimerase